MAKLKISFKPKRGKSGTLIASVPVAASQEEKPQQKRRLFQTQAQMNIHIRSGQRPSKFRYRRAR